MLPVTLKVPHCQMDFGIYNLRVKKIDKCIIKEKIIYGSCRTYFVNWVLIQNYSQNFVTILEKKSKLSKNELLMKIVDLTKIECLKTAFSESINWILRGNID